MTRIRTGCVIATASCPALSTFVHMPSVAAFPCVCILKLPDSHSQIACFARWILPLVALPLPSFSHFSAADVISCRSASCDQNKEVFFLVQNLSKREESGNTNQLVKLAADLRKWQQQVFGFPTGNEAVCLHRQPPNLADLEPHSSQTVCTAHQLLSNDSTEKM